MRRNHHNVDARTFIQAWQTSNTVGEVIRKTGLLEATARQRASNYRKRGIPLRRMNRGRPRVDWEALAQFARDLEDK